jgi:DNA invertase Pin-like site-specific DNA recombinase
MQGNAIQNGGEPTESGLTAKQEAAIVALLSQRTTRAAAKSAGVNEATLWRWLQEPEF